MSTEIIDTALVVRDRAAIVLTPVMDVNTAKLHMREFQEFIAEYLEESTDGGATGDYGVIAGTKKKTLLKSGADKLCEVYGLADEYIIKSTIDWDKGLFDYEITCVLKSRRDDSLVGTGLGCCSSFESKYRYRDEQRKCPSCGGTAIIKGKAEYGGGWLCFAKKGGCGAKFKDGDKSIEGQTIGRVENPDMADIKNTVYKMAKKRAKIDATIGATRSSGILTQDLDDLPPMAPTKPPVETTAEDIPLTRSGASANGGSVESKGSAPAPETTYVPEAPVVEGTISKGEQAAFARQFKEALPSNKRTQAEVIRHQWLKDNGFTGPEGPTSAVITTAAFQAVKKEACTWASKQ